MTSAVKQFVATAGVLIAMFLALAHFTGFARDVGALGSGTVGIIKQLQGN